MVPTSGTIPSITLACLAVLILHPLEATSGVLFYDGFDYETGEDALHGRGVWAELNGGSSADVDPGSLGYVDAMGNTLKTTGNHARVDTTEESTAVDMISPAGVFSLSPTGGEIWISAVMEHVNSQTISRNFGLSFRAADNTFLPHDGNSSADEILAIGTNSGQTPMNWRVLDRALVGRNATSSTPSSVRCFLLVKMELNVPGLGAGNLERSTLWVNPLLDRAPAEGSGFTFTSQDSDINAWSDINAIRIAAGIGSPPSQLSSLGLIDEVRIGDTFADVMPHEPAFSVERVTRLPDGSVQLAWRSRPNRTDIVEYSTDMQNWIPFNDSTRQGPQAEVVHSYTAVPPPEALAAKKFSLRVRRLF